MLLISYVLITSIFSLNIVRGEEANRISYINYTISKDDTLWSVSKQYKPFYMPVQAYIEEIKNVNYIRNNMIYEGSNLIIPIWGDHE